MRIPLHPFDQFDRSAIHSGFLNARDDSRSGSNAKHPERLFP
jgi:hypothetical protein